jgi:hypothetical protein
VSAVAEAIVREYFELHGFFVRQGRKYLAPAKGEDDQVDFSICNPRCNQTTAENFILSSADLKNVCKAIVVVKAWHTETFSPTVLTHAPEIFRFVDPAVFKQAAKAFGQDGSLLKILVVPALPQTSGARNQSIELLRGKGVDAVLPFRTMLADLIDSIEVNRNYQKSDLLQVIRILKNYELLRDSQLELFRPRRRKKKATD